MHDLITRLMTLTNDGVLRHTLDDGRILLANRGMVRLLDLDCAPEDLAGRHLKDLMIFTGPADTFRAMLKEGHGEAHDRLYRFRTLKGKDKLAIYSAVLINDPKTGLQIVEAIIKDVTDIQRTADFLKESEQRFSQIAETATDMIWEVDASGRYTYRSASAESILGYSNREVVGHKYFFDFFTPETRAALKKAALDTFARKEPFRRFVNPNVHKNGRTVILETSGAPILDKDGNLIGYRGTDKDITAYIDAENALKESESRYRQLVDNTDTGFVVIDDAGIVLEANDPYMRLIGATKKEDVIGHSVVEWTAPEEQMNNAAAVARCAKQGHIQDFETIYRRTDGKDINILVNATVQESPHGKRLVSFCRNISERKRAEAALAQEKERLAITLQSIGDGVIATDIQGRIMLFNKVASELTGWPEKEAVGRPLTEVFRIINEQTRQPCDNPVKQVLQMGITVGLANHTALIARDGTVRNIADSGAPIHDSHGRVNGVVLVFRDVTEQRQMATALRIEQEQLQIIFDSCPAKIFFKDTENRVVRANKAFVDSLGLRREDVEGKSTKVLFPEHAKLYWESDKAVIASGQPQTGFIVPLKTSTGMSWAQVDKVPYRDKEGRIIGVVGFSIDITERINAENALKESETKLATAFRNIPDPTALSSLTGGQFLEVNDGFIKTLGFPREEVLGHTSLELKLWAKPEERQRIIQMISKDGHVSNIEVNLRCKSGEVFPALFSAEAIKIGGQLCLITVARDVTVFKKAEQEREKLNQELNRTNQELETLIRIVTHDLRSPLVNIQGFGQILDKACGEITHFLTAAPLADEMRRSIVSSHEKIEKSLRFINASVDKMNGLINGLLRLSRLGRAPLVSKPVDMNALIKAVLEAMAFQMRTAAGEVTADALPACQGDATLINQVCSNLLDNAIKYRDRTRTLRVRIWGRREGAQSVYCIEDNGVGMAPEHQQKIWNVFYRPNPQENVLGDGIGLSAVKLIVDRHGGKVWMESEVGKGSRFFLSLPAGVEKEL